MRKVEKLPKFRSRAEEVRFWDHHDPLDYWDQLEKVDEVFVLAPELARRIQERAKTRLFTMRVQPWQIDEARRIARSLGVPYQRLLRTWITEGIRRSGEKRRTAR